MTHIYNIMEYSTGWRYGVLHVAYKWNFMEYLRNSYFLIELHDRCKIGHCRKMVMQAGGTAALKVVTSAALQTGLTVALQHCRQSVLQEDSTATLNAGSTVVMHEGGTAPTV